MANLKEIRCKAELEAALHDPSSPAAAAVLHFSGAKRCEASRRQMDHVFSQLATDFPRALFLRVEVDGRNEISDAFKISETPYFVFYKDGEIVETLGDADPSSLANKVASLAGPTNSDGPAVPASLGMAAGPTIIEKVQEMSKEKGASYDIHKPMPELSGNMSTRVKQLIGSHPIFLFMKGTPEQPKCLFSEKVVKILREKGIAFCAFDVLTNDEMREAVKLYSNWPAYPQLYCNGSLVGGGDIVIALHQNGELSNAFKNHGFEFDNGDGNIGVANSVTGLSDRLTSHVKNLINAEPVMVFLEGIDNGKGTIEILREERVPFETFDVLWNEEVKEGLKVLSNWSAYPQVYVKGEFVGGSDIVLEMHKSGELKRLLSEKVAVLN